MSKPNEWVEALKRLDFPAGTDALNLSTVERVIALSQAISLKRIADTLERFQSKLEAEEARERGPTSSDDLPGGRGD